NTLVQYFDKGRLEVNDPDGDVHSPWYVTSGLLVAEMVSGSARTGDHTSHPLGPARIPVAGDAGGPTYADFATHMGRTTGSEGAGVTTLLQTGGATAPIGAPPAAVRLTMLEPAAGHYWADVFWQFATGPARPAQFAW